MPRRFAAHILDHYRGVFAEKSKRDANLTLLDLSERLSQASIRLASSDADLCNMAQAQARGCSRIAAAAGDVLEAFARVTARAEAIGIDAPQGRGITPPGAVARLCDERWWRRGLRRRHGRTVEHAAIEIGMVHKRAGVYASDETVERRRAQRARNRTLLEELQAVNEQGQTFTLQELAELTVSNPKLRRAELMARLAGFEAVADSLDHAKDFWTITCPSRMHARHHDGRANEHYDGTTPRQAQQYLCRQWAKIRAALGRRGVKLYGFRVAEPHHDGTPHWHLAVCFPRRWPGVTDRAALPRIRALVRRYALQADKSEPGAREHRFKAETIDPNKGTLAGYLAKYISKGIDGFGVDFDLFGVDAAKAAERITAWAANWGIRQYQQLGGPPVTVWRELRRLATDSMAGGGPLVDAWAAADTGNWKRFVEVMGGPDVPRGAHPVKLVKRAKVAKAAGEIKTNRYGEPLTEQVLGVECGTVFRQTRIHQWSIAQRTKQRQQNAGFSSACTVENAVTKCAQVLMHEKGRQSRRTVPTVDHRQHITVTVTEAGERLTEIQAGTVLSWADAQRLKLPENIPGKTFFVWRCSSATPWSSVNNCTVHTAPSVDYE